VVVDDFHVGMIVSKDIVDVARVVNELVNGG
jgi:hypothetical protein